MRSKTVLIFAAAFGMLAVIFGALGAHALEAELTAKQLTSFNTGVRYQSWHALALFALFATFSKLKFAKITALLWIIGVFLFSGSIYFLSLQELMGLNLPWLGPITPLGGLALITGWFFLLLSAIKYK